jgi:uncharacterized repeat protein (TIGR03803 family)
MQSKRFALRLGTILAIFTVALFAATSLAATEKVLHNFGSGMDGTLPTGGLIMDAAGDLYGTTAQGGVYGFGTVFEMSPREGGSWTEKTLHNFGLYPTDGKSPVGGLIFDAAGNLYGTTGGGGDKSCNGSGYCGTVFELMPNGSGGWTEKVIHNFGSDGDGVFPIGLILDASGNLFGVTGYGGDFPCYIDYDNRGCGTAFIMTPNGSGGWTEKKLHNFGSGEDGVYPWSQLSFDAAGNLYGTTIEGGVYGGGTVFEMTPRENGSWTEKVLHNFGITHTDGTVPAGSLIFDTAGNLYGMTNYGGDYIDNYPCYYQGCGTVFQLTPKEGGGWTERKLHSFGRGIDGTHPNARLIFDAAGDLYGTTEEGGSEGKGAVFEMTPSGSGGWTEKVIHNFRITDADGIDPAGSLIFDTAGNLYGMTSYGGDYGLGTVFEVTP